MSLDIMLLVPIGLCCSISTFFQFKQSLIKERQMEGVALAKKRGAYKGRKPTLTPVQTQDIKSRILNGEKKVSLLEILELAVKHSINI